MEKQKQLRGYVFSRKAAGQFVPQRIQNMFIREYVELKGGKFLLSTVEYYMENCYMMLESTLEKINEVDGLAFFSMTYLPKDKEKRMSLYKTIFDNGKELHFALENYAMTSWDDVEALEEIMVIRQLTEDKETIDIAI